MKIAKVPTAEEWQDVVNAAAGALALHSARAYGLVKGGPKVDAERAQQLLLLGKQAGYVPAPDAIENFVAAVQYAASKKPNTENSHG